MLEVDKIYNMDCLEGIRQIESGTVSLVIADPPYELVRNHGSGSFGHNNRSYHQEIDPMQTGISNAMLEEMVRVCTRPNMYIFCSKGQLPQIFDFSSRTNLSYDILTWHKTNPVPTCSNKYLSDTEYIVFLRGGAKLYGTYETKRKYFITPTNASDKKKYRHPTPKPVHIISTLIENSSLEGDLILDPYMGSGTTAIASIQSGRHFIGFEINQVYYENSIKRINDERQQMSLF